MGIATTEFVGEIEIVSLLSVVRFVNPDRWRV